jgi:anti-sigma factor (TIGR02949 family)
LNCKDALRLLYEVIDQEADQLDVVEVEKHLKNCRHCMARYEFEKMFRTFVTEKGRNINDNSKLKQQVLQRLDMIDAAGGVGVTERPFKFPLWKFAAAAVVILCIVSAFWAGTVWHYHARLAPFIEAHYTRRPTVATPAAFEPGVDPLEFLYQKTGIRLEASDSCPVDHIRSVTVDTVDGTVFGRINMVCDNGEPVTLFVSSVDSFDIPSGPQETIDGCPWLVHCDRQSTLLGRTKNNVFYLIVAPPDHPRDQLTRVVNAF